MDEEWLATLIGIAAMADVRCPLLEDGRTLIGIAAIADVRCPLLEDGRIKAPSCRRKSWSIISRS